ncbi:MAG: thioredoxin [Holosporales bacterium]|jgi:thioredoxin 1|nr:thioredoxin [Holosporales bacterium]
MIDVTSEADLQDIIDKNESVVVDFWATWCGPCRMLLTIMDDVSKDIADTVFVKVNVEDAKDIAMKYDVQTLPTVIVFKSGNEVISRTGFMSKSALVDLINS